MKTERAIKTIEVVTTKQVKHAELRTEFTSVRSPEDAANILFTYLEEADREHMVVMALDTKNQVNKIESVSIGSLNASIVHPREIFKMAILSNAASIILGHNHPSGVPEPSQEDISVTKRLIEAGSIIGIEILDHVIIGDPGQFYSMKQKGFI